MSNETPRSSGFAWFTAQPRRTLLLDAAGASMSALGLGVLLPALHPWVGLPVAWLRGLAGVALVLCVIGLASWSLARPRWRGPLRGLALANASYAVGTALLLVIHRQQLEVLGWIYFGLELAVLVWLVRFEWRMTGQPE